MAPHPNGSESESESDDDDTGGGAQPSPPPSPSLQVVDLHVGLGESVVSPPENPTLRALLWNIQDLGGGPSRGPKRPPEVKQAIARIIWQCRADVVALLELKKSGKQPARPEPPMAPTPTRHEPFTTRFGPLFRGQGAPREDFARTLSSFVYALVTTIAWEPAVASLAHDDEPEVDPKEIGEKDKAADTTALEGDPVGTLATALVAAHHDVMTNPSFGLGARVLALRDDAVAVARLGVADWSTVPLWDTRTSPWPRLPADDIRELLKKCADAPPTSFRAHVLAQPAVKGLTSKPPAIMLPYLAWLSPRLAAIDSWATTLLSSPCPADDADAQVWRAIAAVLKDVQAATRDQQALRVRATFLHRVVREILREVVARVGAVVGQASNWHEFDDEALARAMLNSAYEIRMARYEQAMQRYQAQVEEMRASGSYPGLLEFLEIAEQVCAQASDEEPDQFDYGVWPPLPILRLLSKEVTEYAAAKKTERGPVMQFCARFFTADEAYGIFYNRRVFYGPGDALPDGRAFHARPYFLPSYSKRAPIVVPLRERSLGVDVEFVAWHAPAPSAGNAEIRATDFPRFARDAAAMRSGKRLAIFMSDTNVDTRVPLLDQPVEHWHGTAPTRRTWLAELTGDPSLIVDPQLIVRDGTSLVRSKLVDLGGGKRFFFHNAAYDKLVAISTLGWRGSRLIHGQQQIVSPTRAILPHREPRAPNLSPPQTPVYHPPSPLVSISYQLDDDLGASLRHTPPSATPRAQAQQLLDDAHELSDHDGVLADFVLTGPTEPQPDFTPLFEAFREQLAHSGGSDVFAEILGRLRQIGEGIDETRLGEEILRAQPDLASDEQTTPLPEAASTLSAGALRKILLDMELQGSRVFRPAPPPEITAQPTARALFGAYELQAVDNPGGGACLLYSLCQLHHLGVSRHSALGLRLKAIAHLRAMIADEIVTPHGMGTALDQLLQWHAAGFPGVAAYAGTNWNTYLREMAKPDAWGDLILLSAISHMFGQSYHIFVQTGAAAWETDVQWGGDPLDFVNLYCENQFHWQALVGIGGALPASQLEPPSPDAQQPAPLSQAPSPSFPFDTSRAVVLWDTSDPALLWNPGRFAQWGVQRWLFVFGDNGARYGMGGQAVIRGQSNAVGLRTCKLPSGQLGFAFSDAEIDTNKQWIEEDLAQILQLALSGQFDKVVFPYDYTASNPLPNHAAGQFDLGTHLAAMPASAPLTFMWLQHRLEQFVMELEQRMAAPAPTLSPSPSGGSPPPTGGGLDDDDEGPSGDGGAARSHPRKRLAPEPSGAGPYKQGHGEQDSLEVLLCAQYGSASGVSGFAAPDVTSPSQGFVQIPVRRFAPHVGIPPLEPDFSDLERQFEEACRELPSQIEDPSILRVQVRTSWGGDVSPELGESPTIREALAEFFQTIKRARTEDALPDTEVELPTFEEAQQLRAQELITQQQAPAEFDPSTWPLQPWSENPAAVLPPAEPEFDPLLWLLPDDFLTLPGEGADAQPPAEDEEF
ncbi:MAG: hypothetical protein IPK74_08340 [Deltaproteobacteria bacterium]|nr:hypothetical protein [Deltaproteobacteria bacterium]